MSRIGKIPVNIPKDVKITIDKSVVNIEGPKGKKSVSLPLGVSLENKEGKLFVNRFNDSKQNRSNHGTVRAILQHTIIGVTQGHKKNLEIQGVGYRAQLDGKKLMLNLGFSHPVEFIVPEGVTLKLPKPTEIEVEGVDKALVGEVVAEIRSIKPPEPYKGKGIRYSGEYVKKKQGKAVTK
jgi:large subunit ribosomal protein L6